MSRLRVVPSKELNTDGRKDQFVPKWVERFESPAIVRDVCWYTGHPYERISPDALEILLKLTHLPKPYGSTVRVAVRLLDIYLQVTGQRVLIRRNALSPKSAIINFCGALYSPRFIHASASRRFTLVATVRDIAASTNVVVSTTFPHVSTLGMTAYWAARRTHFEAMTLDEEMVWRARGWPVKYSSGMRWLDLRAIHARYGREFACAFQRAAQMFYDSRRQESIHQIGFFIEYLAGLEGEWVSDDFLDPDKTQFLFSQYVLHFAEVKGQEFDYASVQANWTKGCNFFRKALFPSGLFATPRWKLPELPSNQGVRHTHIREDENGEKYHVKLLTDVPLKLDDKQAAEILFGSIKLDLGIVKKWADEQIDDIWGRHKKFIDLAIEGEVREFSTEGYVLQRGWTRRSHKRWRANVAATFFARGFETADEEPRLSILYGEPLADVHRLLALPTAGALLPHMAVLVMEHPQITPSFLTELELFDAYGHLTGVSEFDTKWVLEGSKARKGPDSAQQAIVLSDRAAEVLAQVVSLTEPLRTYLRVKGDTNWRRVFLECKKGFDTPMPVNAVRRTSGKDNVKRLTAEFTTMAGASLHDSRRLASRFSLVTLRASVVVARYLEKPDLARAAKHLGHERLSFSQIERYIPRPLIAFFEERWVRLFQNAVIAEALKESEYRLRATDLSSLDELHEFLKNHALKVRPTQSPNDIPINAANEEVYFAASVETLAVLVGIRAAVSKATRTPSSLAIEWAEFAGRLERYIRQAQPPREELIVMMCEAQERSGFYNFEEVIYG